MKLDQNEILSLLFLSTSFEKEINMKEINEFLDIYTKNGDNDDKYYFYMTMHDDFNLELFEENKENGNFKLTKNNELVQNKIRKIVLNVFKRENNKVRTLKTMNEYNMIYKKRKMSEEKNNRKSIKELIFKRK